MTWGRNPKPVILPGESYYPLYIDPFMAATSDGPYPPAPAGSAAWVRADSSSVLQVRTIRIPAGDIVTILRNPGEGEFVGEMCRLRYRGVREEDYKLVEALYGDIVCIVSVDTLFPIDSEFANGVVEATRNLVRNKVRNVK